MQAMPGTGVQELPFWSGFGALVRALTPRNAALLQRRDELQSKIDAWHRQHHGAAFVHSSYKAYLLEIGYLLPEQAPFAIDTANIDPEIAQVAGPQLVVPVSNARYALNAANARWGPACTTRSMAPTPYRRPARLASASTIRNAAQKSSPSRAISWTCSLCA